MSAPGRSRLPGTPEPMHRWHLPNGITVAGDSWGEAGAPLVVLQHGGGQTRHAWKGTGEKLAAAGYRALAFDARGHGDTDWPEDGDYDQLLMVDDLVGVLEQVEALRPVLVGASMGGGTSLTAVGNGSVDASALVLVDIAPRLERDGASKILDFMNEGIDGFDSLDAVADSIAGYQMHRPRARRLDGLVKNVRLGDDGRYYWHWDPRYGHRTRDLDGREDRLVACARSIAIPTLLVRGGLSDVLSEQGAAAFLELCPHAEYVNVTGAAHMVAGDRNDIFTAAVVDFLSRAVPIDGPAVPRRRGAIPPSSATPGIVDIP